MTQCAYDFICSIGELIDKLTIENIKCYDANTKIIRERSKAQPDALRISDLELVARTSGEQRVRLKDEINRRIADAVSRKNIGVAPEVRTYSTEKRDG